MIKHMVCHLYPRSQPQTWRRTVAHLLARWRLWDGKKVIAIVTDDSTDTVETVQAAFGNVDAQFVTMPNYPPFREVLTHAHLYNPIEGLPGATFYCHGKGSTHQPDSVCQWWADLQWHVNCDYPRLVDCALEQHPIAGAFRRFGCLGSEWHYSGTFYWARNDAMFARNWREIDSIWYGSETWPAKHFRAEESSCLFLDHAGELYDTDYWRATVTPAFQHWRERLRSCGLSTMDCATTDWSRLPETHFQPLIGLGGSATSHPESGRSQRTGGFLRRALTCCTR